MTDTISLPADGLTGEQLRRRELPPLRWAVSGLFPEGLSLLAGKLTTRKSSLALHAAMAVADGSVPVCGKWEVPDPGDVLFLALNDNAARVQARLTGLGAGFGKSLDLSRLHVHTEWPAGEDGLILLGRWLREHAGRLAVIDGLSRLWPRLNTRYLGDLRGIALWQRASIVVLHDLRHRRCPDPIDEVQRAVSPVAPDVIAVWTQGRRGPHAMLEVAGPDVAESRAAITHDAAEGSFRCDGDAGDARIGRQRREVLDLLNGHGGGMRVRDIAGLLDKKTPAICKLLKRMVNDGEVSQLGDLYIPLSS